MSGQLLFAESLDESREPKRGNQVKFQILGIILLNKSVGVRARNFISSRFLFRLGDGLLITFE